MASDGGDLIPAATSGDALRRAEALYAEGQPEEAADLLEAHLEERPDDVPARLLLARTFSRMRDAEAAVEELTLALERQPHNAEALALRGAEHYFADQLEEADDLLQQALAVDLNQVEAIARLAQVRVDQGRADEAAELVERGLSVAAEGSREEALLHMAEVYRVMRQKDPKGALELIGNHEDLWAKYPYIAATIRSNQAIIEARRRNMPRARELLIDALDLDPYFHMARGLLGQVALLEKDYDLAIDQLSQVVENGERVGAYSFYALAASLAARGRELEAVPYYQMALNRGLGGLPSITAKVAVLIPSLKLRYAALAIFLAALLMLTLRLFDTGPALALVGAIGVVLFQIVRGGR